MHTFVIWYCCIHNVSVSIELLYMCHIWDPNPYTWILVVNPHIMAPMFDAWRLVSVERQQQDKLEIWNINFRYGD